MGTVHWIEIQIQFSMQIVASKHIQSDVNCILKNT